MELNKILSIIAIFLALMILSTTIYVKTKPENKVTVVRAQTLPPAEEKLSSYKELGKIRSVTAPEKGEKKGIPVVVTPLLSYTKDDQAFFEELSRKNSSIKSVFAEYFTNQPLSQLKAKGEAVIKAELLAQVNSLLTLNKIQEIYFDDLIFLD